jgi:uncharacterized membrane protein YkoI
MLTLVCVGGRPAFADDGQDDNHHDHDRARHALEEGRALPLAAILDRVAGRLGGEVVGVEFDREKGRYVYEFRVITPAGRLQEVLVDAKTAEILKREDD